MGECGNELQKEHGERIAKVEVKVEHIENKIEKLDNIETAITKLSLLMEQQINQNNERDKDRKKQNEVLTKISVNLDGLNNELKETNLKFENLESKVDSKISKIESKFNSSEDLYKVDIRIVVKNFISKYWIHAIALGYVGFNTLKTLKIIK